MPDGYSAQKVADGSSFDVRGQTYWLAADGAVDPAQGRIAFFVLDLKEVIRIDRIKLVNTDNALVGNRGTAVSTHGEGAGLNEIQVYGPAPPLSLPVPEPSCALFLPVGLAGILFRRRTRRV